MQLLKQKKELNLRKYKLRDMEKEEIKNQAEGVDATPMSKRQALNQLLSSEIDGYNPDDEEGSAGMLSEYVQRNIDDKKRFSEAIQKDPRLAQVFSDVVSGKRSSGAALARYFGKDLLNAKEGTAEYDEIIAAEKERLDELEASLEHERKFKENVSKSMPLLKAKCEAAGVDCDEFCKRVWDEVIFPITEGHYDVIFDVMQRGFNYEKDVNDAMAAGETKGRNTRINQMRDNRGDGMPKNMSSATMEPERKKAKRNPFIEAALNA